MELLTIIILGYVINFGVLIVMAILMFIIMLFNMRDTEYLKKFQQLESLQHESNRIKEKLSKKGLSVKVQDDYIIFIPYAMGLQFLVFLHYTFSGRMLDFIGISYVRKIDILERRYNEAV